MMKENTTNELKEINEDANLIKVDFPIPTKWFKTEQISTWVGKPLSEQSDTTELEGGHATLIVQHQCGTNKKELITQLKLLIDGIKTDFESFSN